MYFVSLHTLKRSDISIFIFHVFKNVAGIRNSNFSPNVTNPGFDFNAKEFDKMVS